jgi:two-component system, cell cycle response regulator
MDEETIDEGQETVTRRLDRFSHSRACLVVISGPSLGERHPIMKPTMVLGRAKDADLFIDDLEASRKHAEVTLQPDGRIVIRDLRSRNGTYCNGQKTESRELRDGDLVGIGRVTLKFLGPNNVEQVYLQEMSTRARRDGLTGLFNKETFQVHLERSLARCRDLREPLSLAMMDLDGFKKTNDTLGHLAGDYVLKEFSRLINRAVRPTDFLARYGGEEFVLILPHTALSEALAVGERLRAQIEAHMFVYEGANVSLTLSIGISDLGPGIDRGETLLLQADKALYQAKENGKNQVQSYTASG